MVLKMSKIWPVGDTSKHAPVTFNDPHHFLRHFLKFLTQVISQSLSVCSAPVWEAAISPELQFPVVRHGM